MVPAGAEATMEGINDLFAARFRIVRAGDVQRHAVLAESEFGLASCFVNIAQDFARQVVIFVWLEAVVARICDCVQDELLGVGRFDPTETHVLSHARKQHIVEIISRSEEGERVFNAKAESVNQKDTRRHHPSAKATDDYLSHPLPHLMVKYLVSDITLIDRRASRQIEFQCRRHPARGRSALSRWLLSRSSGFALGALFCKFLLSPSLVETHCSSKFLSDLYSTARVSERSILHTAARLRARYCLH